MADSCAMGTAEWRGWIVHEFLKHAATPGDINSIDYCDSYRSVMMDDSTRVSVDCVTFPSGDEAIAKWLNGIPDSTYIEPDIPAEAPEKCITFRKSSILVIVWCNLFADSDEVFNRLYEMYLPFTDNTEKRIPSVIVEAIQRCGTNAACGGRNFWKNERSDFITRLLHLLYYDLAKFISGVDFSC